MKSTSENIIQTRITGFDMAYRELKCRWKNCGRVFASHRFRNECSRCEKLRKRLQQKFYGAGKSFSSASVLELALKLLPAFPRSRWQ